MWTAPEATRSPTTSSARPGGCSGASTGDVTPGAARTAFVGVVVHDFDRARPRQLLHFGGRSAHLEKLQSRPGARNRTACRCVAKSDSFYTLRTSTTNGRLAAQGQRGSRPAPSAPCRNECQRVVTDQRQSQVRAVKRLGARSRAHLPNGTPRGWHPGLDRRPHERRRRRAASSRSPSSIGSTPLIPAHPQPLAAFGTTVTNTVARPTAPSASRT